MARLEGSAFILAEGAVAWARRGTWLVLGDASGWAERWLDAGADLVAWRRRAFGGPSSDLVNGWFVGAVVALPASREELRMDLELAAARLPLDAPVYVHGSNKEGIKTVGDQLEPWFQGAETMDARRHARVWRAHRTSAPARADLELYAERRDTDVFGQPGPWFTWPGCFAGGDLDAGTKQLLADAPAVVGSTLDLACGIGVIAAGLRRAGGRLCGCDVDGLSVRAASRNGRYDALWVGDGLDAVPRSARWDLVISNPPVHRGVLEDVSVLRAIVRDLPDRMNAGGTVRVVVQRHRAFARWLAEGWRDVRVASETSKYQVVEGRR